MKLQLILLGVLGIASASSGCGKTPETSTTMVRGENAPLLRVLTAEVRASNESGSLEIPASIESSRRAVLTSRLAATIVEMSLREGDSVKAGTSLVRLENAGLSAALSAAQASDRAAVRDLTRAEALLAKGAATRNEVETADTAAARTRSAVVAAREALSYATIEAPFPGRVTRKIASVGDTVTPGQPLLEIEGEGGLEVVASVDGSVFERLKAGQRIDVRVDGVTAPVVATIRTLGPSADPSTHRFTIRAELRTREAIHAGLFARVLLPLSGTDRRLLVPEKTVLRRGGLTGVYVIQAGHAWLRWIAPGDSVGEDLEVRAGLDEQERVALEPARLHDGALVTEGGQ